MNQIKSKKLSESIFPSVIKRIFMIKRSSIAIKLISFISILALGIVIMIVLGASDKKSTKREVIPEIRKVETIPIIYRDVQLEVAGNGVIESRKTLDIVSEVYGLVVYAVNDLKSGTYVNKGELICKIDPRQAENNIYSLRSELMKTISAFLAHAMLDDKKLYEKWLTYFNTLETNTDIPEFPEISNSREKILISSHNLFTQYYTVKNAEILLSKHTINAPFNGYITSNDIIRGSFVSAGQIIITLRDIKNIEISIPLLLEDANWVDFSGNPPAKIFWGDNQQEWVTGTVIRKDNQLDRNSQSINVFVQLENSDLNPNLFPGNYVNVLIQGKTIPDVATVPRFTIDNDNNIYFVDEESKLGRTTVDIVSVQGDVVLIRRSLPDNIRIVTTILQKPLIGMPIQDVSVEMDNATENDSVALIETPSLSNE